jgi:hypothetical protein
MGSFVGWLRLRPLVAQLSEDPHPDAIGLLRLLFGSGLRLVTAGYVVVPARPPPVVPGCAVPRSGHPISMTNPGSLFRTTGPV